MELKVKLTDGAPLPKYAKSGDAGLDLTSREETMQISPGETVMLRTGVSVELPSGHFGMCVPRSGIASKRGLANVNAPGIIDEGYRGEILVPLHNYSDRVQVVEKGERVCQLIVVPYASCDVVEADELSETERGSGGFGSSGRL